MSFDTEKAIAQAQEVSRNKYATAHMNAAHARLLAAVINNPAIAFTLHPTADQFEDAAEGITKIAEALNDYAQELQREANGNARSSITYSSIMDGVDELAAGMRAEAEDLREAELEAAE